MFNISKQTFWFIIILTTLVSIYLIFTNYDDNYNSYNNHNNHNDNSYNSEYSNYYIRPNSRETSNIIRKIKNKKYAESKKIHESPYNKSQSIASLTKQLKKKLTKTNYVDKNPELKVISESVSKPQIISKPKPKPKYILKLFYADWCPHCVDFKPIWNKIKNQHTNIDFVNVDCTNNSPQVPYVKGFPTIALLDSNERFIETYENDRSYEDFNSYVENLLN